jgi:hypothetical protein
MRLVFWFTVALVVVLAIYRRIIEPFLEGFRDRNKPYNEPLVRSKRKRKALVDRSSVEDADFEDIK